MKKEEKSLPKCPLCNREMEACFDEWGHTPWHLHCLKCDINIGFDQTSKANTALSFVKVPHTYIKYYFNDIQLFIQEGVVIKQ